MSKKSAASAGAPAKAQKTPAPAAAATIAPKIPVDLAQMKKAIVALYTYIASRADAAAATTQRKQLFSEEEYVYLQVALKKAPGKNQNKPYRIPLKNPLYLESDICLITKDPQETYEERLEEFPVENLSRLLSFTKLRKEFHQYKDKRALLNGHDLFLADARVLPLLHPHLGQKFFEKKKQPIPIEIVDSPKSSHRDWRKEIENARKSTFLYIPAGVSILVKVAKVSFSRAETLENLLSVMAALGRYIPRSWENIQALSIKTVDSAALPFYHSLPFNVNLLPENEREAATAREFEEDQKAGFFTKKEKGEKKRKREERKEEWEKKQGKSEEKAAPAPASAKKSVKSVEAPATSEKPAKKAKIQVEKPAPVVDVPEVKQPQKSAKKAAVAAPPATPAPAPAPVVPATPATAGGKRKAAETPAPAPQPTPVAQEKETKGKRKSTRAPVVEAEEEAAEEPAPLPVKTPARAKKAKVAEEATPVQETPATRRTGRKAAAPETPAAVPEVAAATPATRRTARKK